MVSFFWGMRHHGAYEITCFQDNDFTGWGVEALLSFNPDLCRHGK
jgi:hypothetical protein